MLKLDCCAMHHMADNLIRAGVVFKEPQATGEGLCGRCAHRVVCGKYQATGGEVRGCEHYLE